MSSPAEIPHADEALKSLVTRFKASPVEAFIELSAALLARGHASEALRVAEHGLQIAPTSVDGRIERAASLLALGRPRVAYVELRRALAINPTHRRAMRLLGKAFVDSGAPTRAADLLAQRSMNDEREDAKAEKAENAEKELQDERTERAKTPIPRPRVQHHDTKPLPTKAPSLSSSSIPDLFSALTKDLGLGAAVPETLRRVEVTQIIRRKGLLRPPRSPSELLAIEGPIVDATQPGYLIEAQHVDEIDAIAPPITEPLFDRATTDQFQIAGFTLGDDEPLFNDDVEFEVRPVDADEPASRAPTVPTGKPPGGKRRDEQLGPSEVSDTVVDQLEEMEGPLEELRPGGGPAPLNFDEEATPLSPVPVVEKKRPQRVDESPRLEVIDPKPKQAHVALAIAGAIAIVLYTAGLVWASYDVMKPWFPSFADAPAAEQSRDGSQSATARVP